MRNTIREIAMDSHHIKFRTSPAAATCSRWFPGLLIALLLFAVRVTVQGYELVVLPSTTDPNISNVYTGTLGQHYFGVETSAPPRGRLHVFLPGTGGIPLAYVHLLRASATQGFHTVGLTYVNTNAVNSFCSITNDLACHQNVRLETIDGQDRSPLLTVNRVNSIEHRLIKLLSWLNTNNLVPITRTQGWGQYLQGTNIVWSNIIIAGHSQGAGHAAIIAKTRKVARCDMYAWGEFIYTNVAGRPADWLAWTSATPVEAYFGFVHANDDQTTSNIVTACWTTLGLDPFGPIVAVESNTAPYGMSHRLMTWTAPRAGGNAHDAVAVDSSTPLAGTNAVFRPVWEYMVAAPEVAPTAMAVSVSSTQMTIRYSTLTGSQYQMQRTTNFATYTNLGPRLPGNGNVQTSVVGTVAAPAFYRVQITY